MYEIIASVCVENFPTKNFHYRNTTLICMNPKPALGLSLRSATHADACN